MNYWWMWSHIAITILCDKGFDVVWCCVLNNDIFLRSEILQCVITVPTGLFGTRNTLIWFDAFGTCSQLFANLIWRFSCVFYRWQAFNLMASFYLFPLSLTTDGVRACSIVVLYCSGVALIKKEFSREIGNYTCSSRMLSSPPLS